MRYAIHLKQLYLMFCFRNSEIEAENYQSSYVMKKVMSVALFRFLLLSLDISSSLKSLKDDIRCTLSDMLEHMIMCGRTKIQRKYQYTWIMLTPGTSPW